MSTALGIARAITGTVLFALLVLLLLVLNAFQVLSLLFHPLWPSLTRRFNREIANFWWGLCVLLGTQVLKYEVIVTGDPVPIRESALVFANHQEMPDIFILMTFAKSKRRLGDLKFFVKDALKWVPGIGWGMWMLDCVFLRRSWADDSDRIRATFRTFTTYSIPFWLAFFPEGTRLRPDKLANSQRYAREKGRPVLQHVLSPRTKGFTAAMTGLRSRAASVYDLTIAYEGPVPTLWSLITGKSRKAHLHVNRFPMEHLPASEDALGQWLLDRFSRKDALLAYYSNFNRFP